jgi:hypothetical protein
MPLADPPRRPIKPVPWPPFGLGVGLVMSFAWLSAVNAPGRPLAVSARATAATAGNGRLILTVQAFPAMSQRQSVRGALLVQLLGPGGAVLDEQERAVEVGPARHNHHVFDLRAAWLPADQLTVRCRFRQEQSDVRLDHLLSVGKKQGMNPINRAGD